MTKLIEPDAKIVRTMCPMNCHPTLCGMLAEVRDGRLVGVKGDEANPDSRGFPCVRGQASRRVIDNHARLRSPRSREYRAVARPPATRAGPQPPVFRFEIAIGFEARNKSGDRARRLQADDLRDGQIRRKHLVARIVILQLVQIHIVRDRPSGHRSTPWHVC